MPRGDFTGPWGQGPMTGRGAGFCSGYPVPGYANPVGRGFGGCSGRGWGAGRGYRRGHGWMGPGYPYGGMAVPYEADPKQEAVALKKTAEALEYELQQIKGRLAELENNE